MVNIKDKIKKAVKKHTSDQTDATKVTDLELKTPHKNQFITFFKPEVFLDKTPDQIEKIMDVVFKKFEEFKINIDAATIFPGPALAKYAIMDRHYGVINQLSKNASKQLSAEEKKLVHEKLNITDKNLRILGGHEAFEIAEIPNTADFDKYWLEKPSTKIKSGFYVRPMMIAGKERIVVNGFHPHQLAHYTALGRKLVVLLISSDTSWETIRIEMLGDVFPEKALSGSIRGYFYKNAQEYGFNSVTIANNILHVSAGPTEALFEIDNFFGEAFGIDITKDKALLASKLQEIGLTEKEIKKLIHDKNLHGQLENKDTLEAVNLISSKRPN